jgi:hypothetical protein
MPIETCGPYEDLRFEITCDFPPLVGDGLVEMYIVQLLGYSKFYDMNTSCAQGLVLQKVKGKLQFTRHGYFNFGIGLAELRRFVMAHKFDRSETSEVLLY